MLYNEYLPFYLETKNCNLSHKQEQEPALVRYPEPEVLPTLATYAVANISHMISMKEVWE